MGNSIGVIIPTFDRYESTLMAVESALNQSLKPDRVLVVDDGSSAEISSRLRKDLAELGVEYMVLEHTGHPGKVRKIGVEALDTDWVAFLDSDDSWTPEKLQIQMSHLGKSRNSASCTNAFIDAEATKTYLSGIRVNQIDLKDLLRRNSVICSSAVVKREILVNSGGFVADFNSIGAEDYATWLRVSSQTKWDFINQPLVRYDSESLDSISKSQFSKNNYPHLLGLLNFASWKKSNSPKRKIGFYLTRKILAYILGEK